MRRLLATAAVVALGLSACESVEPDSAAPPVATPNSEKGKENRANPDDRKPKQGTPRQEKPEQGEPRQDKPRPSPAPPKQQHQVVRYLVTDVVDGDTVTVAKAGGTTIRIIGIDTPETVHPFEPVECGGPRASAAATALLAGQRVQLVYDPSQGRLDTYDRTLAYLTVPGLGDFGLAMVRRGLAAEYTYDTAYAKQALYQQAESQAQSQDNGIWATCGGVDTPLATPEPPSNPQPKPGANCASGYSPCVPAYPPDLDCDDIDGPVSVTGDDPHGFDADGDGTGCDS